MGNRERVIIELAQRSVFYQNEDGMWRINWTSGEAFGVSDENDDSGEEYTVQASEVKSSDIFHVTREVTVASRLGEEQS